MIENQFAKQTKYKSSHYGPYGGRYVPETLMNALLDLEEGFCEAAEDPRFLRRLKELREEYSGRPTPLTFAEGLTRKVGGARIYLKREDLNHTGAHKINNTLGQALLARRMGKKRLVAETGAGQHGVASATVAALLGMECIVFMGEEDVQRQRLNVFRMKLLGRRWCRSAREREPSRMPPTRRSGIGSPMWKTPFTCSGRRWAPIPIRRWSDIFSG